jgi:hypothetical protein
MSARILSRIIKLQIIIAQYCGSPGCVIVMIFYLSILEQAPQGSSGNYLIL